MNKQEVANEFANQILAARSNCAVPTIDNFDDAERLGEKQAGRILEKAKIAVQAYRVRSGQEKLNPTKKEDQPILEAEAKEMACLIASAICEASAEQVNADGITRGILCGSNAGSSG